MNKFTRFAFCAGILASAVPAWSALPADISVSPVPGSTLESISEFTVSSGWLDKNYSNTSPTVLINGKSYDVTLDMPSNFDMKFTLATPITASGEYSVIIAEGTFTVGWEGDPSPLIEFSYKVENGEGGGDTPGKDEIQNILPEGYSFSPAAGSEVEVLSSFSVTAETEIFLTAASRKSKISINGKQVDAVTSVSGDYGNTLTWKLAKPISTPGYYTVFIPEGSFYGYSEEDNGVFLVTVKVTGGELPDPEYYSQFTTDPYAASEIPSLGKIAVMSPKLTSLYAGPESGAIEVTGPDGPISPDYTLVPDEDDFNEAHVMWLEFTEPITAPGNYVITFPACCFEVAKYPDNWYSSPFQVGFIVSPDAAIDGVDADATDMPARYFTIGGAPVATPITPGIYIRRLGSVVEKIVIR